MKKNTAYTIGSLIILLICAFCFVILPAMTGSGQAGAKSPVFGKYDGKSITMDEGSDMKNFAANYSQMFQQYGQQLDEQTYFYIMNYAFNSTVAKYAYQKEVKNSGFVVSNTAIKNRMIPYFLDENGVYSSKLYKQVPDNVKQDLRASIEDDLYTARFYDDNFGSNTDIIGIASLYGIKESDAELDFLKDFNKIKRGYEIAYFPLSSYPISEIEKYGKTNADKFKKYDLSVITVDDASTAKTITRRLSNNEITFTDAVAEYSQKIYGNSDGKITSSYSYQIADILDNKDDISIIADLPTDTVSSAVKTTIGYSIFKADGAAVNADFTSEEAINNVRDYLTKYESTTMEDYFKVQANTLINEAKASSFKTVCSEHGVPTATIAPFPLNYGSVSIAGSVDTSLNVLANADTNENFLKTAYSLKKDEISKPFVMNKNVVVLQMTSEEEMTNEDLIFNAADLKSYDEAAAQAFVLNSDKLENNFAEVYFNDIMSN